MKKPTCTICFQPRSTEEFTPFCSARCKSIDLGRWLKGSYAIPCEMEDDPEAEEVAAAAQTSKEHLDD